MLKHDYKIFIINEIRASSKGKTIPVQAWTDRESYRRMRLPDFKTIDTGMW